MTEQAIQTAIKKRLHDRGWLVRKIIQCGDAGWPDLEAFKDGKSVHIEVKRPGQKPTDLQAYRHKQLAHFGIEVIVATGINDVEHLK